MILHLILLCTGVLGITTSIVLTSKYKKNSLVNQYLLIVFIIQSIRYFLLGLLYLGVINSEKLMDFNFYPFIILLIPCMFLYFRDIISEKQDANYRPLIHFIFSVLLVVFVILINEFSFKRIAPQAIIKIVLLVYMSYYLFITYKEIRKIYTPKKDVGILFKKKKKILKKWIFFLFICFFVGIIKEVIIVIYGLTDGSFQNGKDTQWITAIVWCLIFYKTLATPEILFGYQELFEKLKKHTQANFVFSEFWSYSNSLVHKNKNDLNLKEKVAPLVLGYIHHIEYLVLQKLVFRSPKFSATDFATMLSVPTSHINYLFKYHLNISFIDFKNMMRIYDAISLIKEGFLKTNTLDSLARKTGFTSYNPFFTSFKEITGETPLIYTKKQKMKDVLQNPTHPSDPKY